jgi:hypothetical protein
VSADRCMFVRCSLRCRLHRAYQHR